MYLVQLFLPVYDNDGKAMSQELFVQVRDEMVTRFGGVTAYARAPATGLWQEKDGTTIRDDIVVYEVMTDVLDEAWWREYRHTLEQRFRQESLIVRAQPVQVL